MITSYISTLKERSIKHECNKDNQICGLHGSQNVYCDWVMTLHSGRSVPVHKDILPYSG